MPEKNIVLQTAVGASAAVLLLYLLYGKWKNNNKKFIKVGKVTKLILYPMKGITGFEVQSAECTRSGLKVGNISDRIFMVIGEDRRFLDQKSLPRLVLLHPRIEGDQLWIEEGNLQPLKLDILKDVPSEARVIRCKMYSSIIEGIDCGDEAAQWLENFTGKPGLRFVQYVPEFKLRPANVQIVKLDPKQYPIAYQAGNTFHVISQPSIDDLNEKLVDNKVTYHNFRPNIVVDECQAFDEDKWKYLKIGDMATFIGIKPCERCTITTVNIKTGEKTDKEPINTLRTYRLATDPRERKIYGQSPLFGMNYGLESGGQISVGDEVYAVLE